MFSVAFYQPAVACAKNEANRIEIVACTKLSVTQSSAELFSEMKDSEFLGTHYKYSNSDSWAKCADIKFHLSLQHIF